MIATQTRRVQSYPDSGAIHTPHHATHAVLICLFYLTLAVAFAAAEWLPAGSGIFLTSVVGALLCGLLITYSRANALVMFGFGLVACFSWTLFQASSQIPELEARVLTLQGYSLLQARALLLLDQWWTWGQTVLRRQVSSNNLIFLFNMSLLLWWIAYFGAWTLLRYGQTWRTILTAGIVTAVNTYYAPTAITLLFVIFVLISLLLLASSHLAALQYKWQREGIRYTTDIVFDFMRNALVFSLIAVTLAWGLPRLGLFQALNRLLEPASTLWEDATDQVAAWNQGLNQQLRASTGTFQDTLTLGGARQASLEPVMYVQAQPGHDQARYWRANAYDAFDGSQWRNTLTDRLTLPTNQSVPAPPWLQRDLLRQTFFPQQDLGYVVLAAPNIIRTTLSTVSLYETVSAADPTDAASFPDTPAETETATLSEAQELVYVKSRERLTPDMAYEATSALTSVTVWDLEQASAHIPDTIRDRYLQLPTHVDPGVVEQAVAWTAGETTRYDQVKALETRLRRIPYDESIEAPPADRDPIAYFLFDVQRGYCDYYATAMVIMLRTLGIPARMAAGYAEGTYDADTGRFLVTEEDAHSWVEVYFGELGWIEFEPTAGESPLQRAPGGPPATSPAETSSSSPPLPDNPQDQLLPADIPEDLLEDLANPSFAEADAATPKLPFWVWLVLGGAGLLGSFTILITGTAEKAGYWFRARLTGSSAFPVSSVLLRYQQLMRWARRLHIALPASATPWERYALLSRALPHLAQPCQAIVRIYVRHYYGAVMSRLRQSTEQIDVERRWQSVQFPLWRSWLVVQLGTLVRNFRR